MTPRVHSFDVFDTLLTRAVGRPTSIFLLMGRLEEVRRITGCDAEEFARLRVNAERRARNGRGEVTLDEIHRELAAGLGLVDATVLRDIELALERRLTRLVPTARTMLKHADDGRRLALSDMYLPTEFVEELLDQHGLLELIDDVHVSSSYGFSKADGKLFEHVLAREDVTAKAFRHIGDNAFADVRIPRFLGLDARAVTAAKLNRYEELWEEFRWETGGLASLFAGASRLARLDTDAPAELRPIVDVAAGVAGPILVAYVLWVLQRAKREGIERLYFLARDGEVLYLLAKKLALRINPDVDLRYLHGSRSVYHRAGLATRDIADAGWAWKAMYRLTPHDVLMRLGLSAEQATAELDRLGLAAQAHEHATDEIVATLTNDPQVAADVHAAGRALQLRVQSYLRQEGLCDGVPYALVDTGWAGRIVLALEENLPPDATPVARAYFFGYMKRKDGLVRPEVLQGYLFDEVAETGYWGDFEQAYGPLETFTVANSGMTQDFAEQDGRMTPVLASPTNPALAGWPWQLYRDVVMRFADHLLLDPDLAAVGADLRPAVAGVLTEFWSRPTKDEARAWGSYVYEDDIQARSRNQLARAYSVRDFALRAVRRGYEGKRLWLTGSLVLTSPGLRPGARAGAWLLDTRATGLSKNALVRRWTRRIELGRTRLRVRRGRTGR